MINLICIDKFHIYDIFYREDYYYFKINDIEGQIDIGNFFIDSLSRETILTFIKIP